MTTPAATEEPYQRTDGPVHCWFGLTYANFAVQHRARLQSMPLEWQRRFVDLMVELSAAYDGQPDPEFEVTTVEWRYVSELSDAEMVRLGITVGDDEDEEDWDGESELPDSRPPEYYLKDGQSVPGIHRVPIPVSDPVPHYNRGRTYLPPDEVAIATVRAARDAERAEGRP